MGTRKVIINAMTELSDQLLLDDKSTLNVISDPHEVTAQHSTY